MLQIQEGTLIQHRSFVNKRHKCQKYFTVSNYRKSKKEGKYGNIEKTY